MRVRLRLRLRIILSTSRFKRRLPKNKRLLFALTTATFFLPLPDQENAMKGSNKVVATLNQLLTAELSAADQYFAHSRMYANWGYHRLYERLAHERDEELEHADKLVRRILFLEGTPDLASRVPLAIGKDVPEMLKNDLAYELAVVQNLRAAIALCESEHDYETRSILRDLLHDTEVDHTYWLEQQLRLIDQLGLANYLQSAAGDLAQSPPTA